MRNLSGILACAAAVLLLPACHGDALGLHGCPTTYNSMWRTLEFDLEHTEPEDCPIYVPHSGAVRETGAVIVDRGNRDGQSSFLHVTDANGYTVAYVDDPFWWDAYDRWTAATYPSYSAGRVELRPDQAHYFVGLRYSSGTLPEAWMTLTYTDRVLASISGPGMVSSGSGATYTAKVTTGSAPFRYRWYLDWDSVGSGSSYTTTFWEGGRSELRLDVIDSRGEAASTLKLVTINECTDGQKVC